MTCEQVVRSVRPRRDDEPPDADLVVVLRTSRDGCDAADQPVTYVVRLDSPTPERVLVDDGGALRPLRWLDGP
jgi:hypothetical protein